jgi:hypothetical protein
MSFLPDFDLEIPFKGDRNYLHSTDVYNALCKYVGEHYKISEIEKTRLIFKEIAQQPLRVVFSQHNTNPKAIFFCEIENEKFRGELIQREGVIKSRISFHEEKIIEKCSFDKSQSSIFLDELDDLEFSPIEVVVAVNKCLHLKYFDQCNGKWLFTEICTKKPLYEMSFKKLKITLKNCLGTKLTRSSIFLDDDEFGYICFSLV